MNKDKQYYDDLRTKLNELQQPFLDALWEAMERGDVDCYIAAYLTPDGVTETSSGNTNTPQLIGFVDILKDSLLRERAEQIKAYLEQEDHD